MTNVYLYGAIGRKFGHRWTLDVGSPAEAIRAIMANRPDFQAYMIQHSEPGYHVYVGPDAQTVQTLDYPAGRQAIKIVPVIAGAAKSPWVGIIVGALLVAAAVVTLNPTLVGLSQGFFVAAGGTGAQIALAAGMMGAGLIVGGVSQLLAGTPGAGSPAEQDAKNQPSYIFSGAVNTTAQGHPVPVGYGRLRVGSAVISAGITTEDIAP